MRGATARFLALLCLSGLAHAAMTVEPDGSIYKDGRPYRGIGVNYFDAFHRAIVNPNDTSYREGFAQLAAHRIPFARFIAGGFWPVEWQLYLTDKAEYFRRFDEFVSAAEYYRIGLIPSLFWSLPTIPDIVGEPCNRWGQPGSATIAFMRQYTLEVVSRYRDSHAIWAWEFGNEYNLSADLPNAAEWRPAIIPELGTALTRSAEDDISTEMLVVAFSQFAATVRQIDPWRPITTGNGTPRPSAWHQDKYLSWTTDSRYQFAQNLGQVTPAPMDMVSIHEYPEADVERFNEGVVPLSDLLRLCVDACGAGGKAVFLGEIGVSDNARGGDPAAVRALFEETLMAIEESDVSLSALWNYDRNFEGDPFNVTADGSRGYMMDQIGAANERLRTASMPATSNAGSALLIALLICAGILRARIALQIHTSPGSKTNKL